jgi:hypothetical protein
MITIAIPVLFCCGPLVLSTSRASALLKLPDITESKRTHLVLFGMQNRSLGPSLAAIYRILVQKLRSSIPKFPRRASGTNETIIAYKGPSCVMWGSSSGSMTGFQASFCKRSLAAACPSASASRGRPAQRQPLREPNRDETWSRVCVCERVLASLSRSAARSGCSTPVHLIIGLVSPAIDMVCARRDWSVYPRPRSVTQCMDSPAVARP